MRQQNSIESCIKQHDKNGLYRFHMERKITDDELFNAIITIDNSVKSKKTNWLLVIHDILFPSATRH